MSQRVIHLLKAKLLTVNISFVYSLAGFLFVLESNKNTHVYIWRNHPLSFFFWICVTWLKKAWIPPRFFRKFHPLFLLPKNSVFHPRCFCSFKKMSTLNCPPFFSPGDIWSMDVLTFVSMIWFILALFFFHQALCLATFLQELYQYQVIQAVTFFSLFGGNDSPLKGSRFHHPQKVTLESLSHQVKGSYQGNPSYPPQSYPPKK